MMHPVPESIWISYCANERVGTFFFLFFLRRGGCCGFLGALVRSLGLLHSIYVLILGAEVMLGCKDVVTLCSKRT